jgi:hypothetical protein
MIDLETGGTSPGCAVFSIGACAFNPQSQDIPTHTFYKEISHTSSMELGLRFERETMDWWNHQTSPIPNGTTHIKQVVVDFLQWINNTPSTIHEHITICWANSPSFDLVILKYIMELCRYQWPFPYYQERDVRTLKAIAFPDNRYKLNNSHNALEDAINQARLVQLAYLSLGLSHENRTNPQPPGNE